ncbi:hypothetical protein [Janibacter melonis]|uniref:hypothetical protein n=1 Tax=Janibacter melonis TaxID=262209 RepID=UPI002095BD89|nr:hypothetical protein [Janibacter melonis]
MGTRTLGLLAVGAVTLAGCTGGGEDPETSSTSIATPTSASSSTSSSSGTSSSGGSTTSSGEATPSSSTDDAARWTSPPETARANTRQGAQEFAKWYTQVTGAAQHLMDGDLIREQSTSGCVKCEDMAALADGRKGVQHPSINPYQQVTRVKVLKWGSQPTFQVDFAVPRHSLLNDAGQKEATVRAEKAAFAMRLERAGDRWAASEFTLAYRDGEA